MRWVMATSDDQRHKPTVVLQELKKQFANDDAGKKPPAEDQEANAITTVSLSKKPTPTVSIHSNLVIKNGG